MKIEKTTKGFMLIAEISSAKQMCLFEKVIHEHSEYMTAYALFKEDNNIQCAYPKYTFVDDNVIASIWFYNIKHTTIKDVIKIEKFIEKSINTLTL